MTTLRDTTTLADTRERPPIERYQGLRMFMANKAAVLGAILLGVILIISYILPLFITTDKLAYVASRHTPPLTEGGPILGTDYLGRDVALIVMHGGSTTLEVAGFAALLIIFVGATIGAFAGYYGGMVDRVLMKVTEFFQVLPGLLFALVVVALFGASTATIVIAIGIVSWPPIARQTRSEFMKQKGLEYVKAAKAIGASNARIILRTILPNTFPILIVQSTLTMGAAILFEAGLAFLGLGDPNNLSWGYYVGLNRQYFLTNWWAVSIPGFMVFLTVLSLSLIGDGLQDAINPKLRGR
ncbi:ABC transporter permease [Jannaschia marina]|uniref:ABC transporter permease n=1 Tax=Jannaschia marina TaxID=2741674 RepID=UPI0015C7F833|nr:ABC transporter permease [Jannaschia marina]